MATIKDAPTNVAAFLDLVACSEGTSKASFSRSAAISIDDGYDVIVAGVDGPEVFTDFSDHPFVHRAAKLIRASTATTDALFSTASGRYQVLCRYFESYKVSLGLPDFSPLSQDLVAIQQIRERGALPHVESGDIATAITLCSNIWASFPGNSYAQGGHSLTALVAQFNQAVNA